MTLIKGPVVPRNHFYKKTDFSDMTKLPWGFNDLPQSVGDEILFSASDTAQSAILTGNIASLPPYGDAAVDGGYIKLFQSSVSGNTHRQSSNVKLYAMTPDLPITEGGFSFAHRSGSTSNDEVGQKVALYNSNPVGSIYLSETFEGITIDPDSITRSNGSATVKMSEPYFRNDELTEYVNSNLGQTVDLLHEPKAGRNLMIIENMRSVGGGAYESEFPDSGPDVRIRCYTRSSDNTAKVVWNSLGPNYLTRNKVRYGVGGSHRFDREDIEHLIHYSNFEMTTSDLESTPAATTGNTIFSDIATTQNAANPFDSSDANPLILSEIDLSTENSLDGGQALRLYHNWGYSPHNETLQNQLGVSGNLNPQSIRASMYNIPMPPPPVDIGRNTVSATDSTAIFGNHRAVVPEIDMALNFSKMMPNVQVNISGCAKLANPSGYYNQTTLDKAHCGATANTFLRSVVVTFSNYKPKQDHTTVDKFINYGLNRFYGGQTTENVVGGVVFTSYGIGGNPPLLGGEYADLYAMPIPVTAVGQCTSGNSVLDSTVMKEAGLVKLIGTTATNDTLKNIDILSWGELPFVTGQTPQYCTLPMNSWINMRTFMNSEFFNNTGSASLNPYRTTPTYSDAEERGSCMRVYFDIEGVGGTNDNANENIPCLDIPFPAHASNKPSDVGASYRWMDNPNYFPKHMTIWVQNYCWNDKDDSIAADLFTVSDSEVLLSGASREMELFIDNVVLRNFTPDVTNVSEGSASGRLTLAPKDIKSPIGTRISTTNYRSGWVTDKTSVNPTTGSNNAGASASTRGGYYYTYNVGQNVCFGFDDKGDLPTSSDSHSTNSSGYILMNDFRTTDWTTTVGSAATSGYSTNSFFKNRLFKDPSDAVKSGGILGINTALNNAGATYNIPLGQQMFSTVSYVSGSASADYFDTVSGTMFKIDPTGTSLAANAFSLGSQTNDFLSTNALREKGFVALSVSGNATNGVDYGGWTKRESILTSTKIMKVPEQTSSTEENADTTTSLSNNQIKVHNPAIFNQSNEEETYVIYLINEAPGNTVRRTGLKLDGASEPTSGIISFTEDLTNADDGSTALLTEDNLSRLWIGPEKFWVTMTLDTPPSITPRSYQAACTVMETPSTGSTTQTGSTVNEFTYFYSTAASRQSQVKSALYNNIWNVEFDIDSDTIILDKDFGYGIYADGTGGEACKGSLVFNKFNFLDIDKYVQSEVKDVNTPVSSPFMLMLDGISTVSSLGIYTDNYSAGGVDDTLFRPSIYVRYKDLPPVISDLKVSPVENTLNEGVNLYTLTTKNLNAVKFNWNETNGDDIWYRLLMVDTKPILDKYHNATMWVPLNDQPTSLDTPPTYTVHNPTAQSSGSVTVGSSIRAVIEGQGGYAPQMNITDNTAGKISIPSGTNIALDGRDEFTLVLHWTPAASDQGNRRFVVSQSDDLTTLTNNFFIEKQADDTLRVTMGNSVDITSLGTVICDGSTPTSIIVTYHSGSSESEKVKLYINGSLAGSSAGTTKVNNSADFVIGGRHQAGLTGSKGLMEEVIIYSKALTVIDKSNEYIYNTEDILDGDYSGGALGQIYTHNARLIAADYHNFRGSTHAEIGMSNTTSWRTTPI